MLTSLYYPKEILKSLLSGVPTSLPGGFNSCSFFRHVSSNFYSLVQLHMNAKKYRRSRVASRKGHSPLELLTGKPWPEFIDLLEEYGFWDKDMAEQVA